MLIVLHSLLSICVLLAALHHSPLLKHAYHWLFELADVDSLRQGAPLGSGAMFDRIAPVYDLANKYMSFGLDQSWRMQLVKHMSWHEPSTVGPLLDLSTGTGDVAILLAREIQSRGLDTHVVALDPSEGMLGFAGQKVSASGLQELVQLLPGGAEDMSRFGDGLFRQMAVSFGIRNFLKRAEALREMRRVLHVSGRLFVLEFFSPRHSLLAPLAALFLKHALPNIGLLVSGGARAEYVHLSRSILLFPSPTAFVDELQAAGFGICVDKDLFFDIVHLIACNPR